MNTKLLGNNIVTVSGKVKKEPVFVHEMFGEGFYLFHLSSCRSSGTEDVIPVMISDRLINIERIVDGASFMIKGQFRSYNKCVGDKRKLILFVFAKEIEETDHDVHYINRINLDGFICKKPENRITPLGREITDILLAVNRAYGKSDYIPCIAWERNARYASSIDVGSKVRITGRIQSREYVKQINGKEQSKRAYEISISRIDIV